MSEPYGHKQWQLMEKHETHIIEEAFAGHPAGGCLKPICNRKIHGFRCRCYVRYIVLDGIQYWKIHYRINQRLVLVNEEPELIRAMYRLVRTSIEILRMNGQHIVIYKNLTII